MLKRISHKKPAISREKHENDWKQNLSFMNNISAFPEDWYLRDKESRNVSSRSNPNLSTSKSRDESSSKKTPKPKEEETETSAD